MEFEVAYSLDNEQQFWDELDDIVATHCPTHTLIDNALRSYLSFTTNYKAEYLKSEYDIARCSYKLLESELFTKNPEYVRRQIVHCLLQEDDSNILHVVVSFLLFDGRQNEETFDMMNKEAAFPRLLDLIAHRKRDDEEESHLHRLLMELLYEMSRLQRIKAEELQMVEDEFIRSFFQLIEELSNDVNDPYHYPVIKVLLVLNEQFMVTAHDGSKQAVPLTNKVIKLLSVDGSAYKTFGENIILILNRESETSLQLLTLKLLYLLFTTPLTYEYFYTNDLHVLVDILIRNLLDLPEDASALRHTYLRVLYPLLANTQLRYPPHYKRDHIKKLLQVLMRGAGEDTKLELESPTGITTTLAHFGEVDDTTRRLVGRCGRVNWLHDDDQPLPNAEREAGTSTPESPSDTAAEPIPAAPASPSRPSLNRRESKKLTKKKKPPLPAPKGSKTKTQTLGMDLERARQSSLSVLEVAVHKEKPGVITPSRYDRTKSVPLPPPTRGWGRRKKIAEEEERKKSVVEEQEKRRQSEEEELEKGKMEEISGSEMTADFNLETEDLKEETTLSNEESLDAPGQRIHVIKEGPNESENPSITPNGVSGMEHRGSSYFDAEESQPGQDPEDPSSIAEVGHENGKLEPPPHLHVEHISFKSPFEVEPEPESAAG